MESLVSCEMCKKLVSEDKIDRYGECNDCRAADRAGEMTVGDLGGK